MQSLRHDLACRIGRLEATTEEPLSRLDRLRVARTLWRDTGAIKPDCIRNAFMRVTEKIGLREMTAPKMLRHSFATILQDANVDPLIRNELMGHVPSESRPGGGLGMTKVYTHTRPEP